MRIKDKNSVTVVVAEDDAEAGALKRAMGEVTSHGISIVQGPDETTTKFTRRVRGHIDELEREGSQITRAVVVGGQKWRDEKLPARISLVRALMAKFVRRGEGRLILDAGSGARQSQHAMDAMAEALETEVAGSNVTITNRPRAA